MLLDYNNKVKYIVATGKDITEKKWNEKNILFDSILESIQDGISVLNTDLTIRYTNSTMEEWYKDQLPLKGKKCFKAYHDRNYPCESCPTLKSLKTGKVESEVVPGHKDSEINFIELFSYPIWSEDNENITGVVEFVRDISERVNRRKELIGNNTKKLVKAKGNYIKREKFWKRIKESNVITYEREFITKSGK